MRAIKNSHTVSYHHRKFWECRASQLQYIYKVHLKAFFYRSMFQPLIGAGTQTAVGSDTWILGQKYGCKSIPHEPYFNIKSLLPFSSAARADTKACCNADAVYVSKQVSSFAPIRRYYDGRGLGMHA